ncbi:MAG: radical SAM protein, partial [Blastocatellia bacterium]
LMSLLDDLKRSKNFTACVETSPLTATASDGRKKLATLARAGVNRFSIGIQSFNEQLLKRSRGHGQKVVLDALRVVLGLTDNVNIDLIQDLPNQSIDHVLDDLDFVEMLRPSQVTWYIMRLRPESAWFKTYTRSRLDLGDSLSSVQKRVLILDGMTRLGYKPHPGGRFIRDDHFKDDYKTVRAGLDSTLLGLGVSAYSHGWDYLFRNVFSTVDLNGAGEYIRRVRKFGFAIESGYLIDEVENIASRLVSGIRSGARLPDPTPSTEFYLNESRSVLNSLCSFGLIDVDSEGSYSLSETGFLFEEEICSMFYSPAVRERLRTKYSNGAATA